jgi:hypothetical protein
MLFHHVKGYYFILMNNANPTPYASSKRGESCRWLIFEVVQSHCMVYLLIPNVQVFTYFLFVPQEVAQHPIHAFYQFICDRFVGCGHTMFNGQLLHENFNDITCKLWDIVWNHFKRCSKTCHNPLIYKPCQFFLHVFKRFTFAHFVK